MHASFREPRRSMLPYLRLSGYRQSAVRTKHGKNNSLRFERRGLRIETRNNSIAWSTCTSLTRTSYLPTGVVLLIGKGFELLSKGAWAQKLRCAARSPKASRDPAYGKMICFATIGPVKTGWLIKEKGRWCLTEEGKKAYVKFENPEEFRGESSRLYYQRLDR